MPSKLIDLAGQRFGKVVVIERTAHTVGQAKWICRCDCGKVHEGFSSNLRRGGHTSCGCGKGKMGTHGDTGTPTYGTWGAMMRRCYDPNFVSYSRYGARGVTVCARWHDYANFKADMGIRPHGHTLDRKNNDLEYAPSNCRWATYSEQRINQKSRVRLIEYNGEFKPLSHVAKQYGFNRQLLAYKLDVLGLTVDEAMKELLGASPCV